MPESQNLNSSCTIAVGLSGGVDSSVTAALLKEQGYDVHAFFMKNWNEESEQCTIRQDWKDAQKVAELLDIPISLVDFSERYWNDVFERFLKTLETGGTPSPDILCNQYIKFDAFWHYCQNLGFSKMATGHYAAINECNMLCQPCDRHKDQTYFLWSVNPQIWSHVLFPLASYTKQEVRRMAAERGLITAEKHDSTGICFIGPDRFRSFIKQYLVSQPGQILSLDGKPLGMHQGLFQYTLGQRSGLGIGGQKNAQGLPWYVVLKDLQSNTLYIDQDANHPLLLRSTIRITDTVWQNTQPQEGDRILVRIRHGQTLQSAVFESVTDSTAKIVFEQKQRAVTPGQCAVCYDPSGKCLGGGWIVQDL
ncbi:MAG: tRNA 2-thiouridine(34) synthase MnmA [Gammaproteobacteria bacterium]|nr:tRNA 2-thiouridine(34) synthase MnmA [Gammaproteobacteria bacterium]